MEREKVAFVGSSSLRGRQVAGPLLSEMIKLTPGTIVLLRRPANPLELPGEFEVLAAKLCVSIGDLWAEWHQPSTKEWTGRTATFNRDIRMAEVGDRVVAFFREGESMTGGSGHVVEKFHDLGKPSECFEVGEGGSYRWVGGMEAAV